MNTARIAITSSPFSPTPTPPGLISPSFMWTIGDQPAERREAVVHRVHRAVRRAGGRRAPQRGRRPRRTAGPCPRGCRPVTCAVTVWVTPCASSFALPPVSRYWSVTAAPSQSTTITATHRVPLALVLHHPPEGERERERDEEDRVDLEEVAELRRVLERVRRVDVEEPAAVRAEHLDRLLAGHRPAGDLLRGAGHRVHVGEAVEVLDHARAR